MTLDNGCTTPSQALHRIVILDNLKVRSFSLHELQCLQFDALRKNLAASHCRESRWGDCQNVFAMWLGYRVTDPSMMSTFPAF